TSPDFSLSASSASASSWRKRSSPSARKMSGIARPSRATIMSSVSTKQRPSRRARSRAIADFPAPMKPTRMTLSARISRIVSDRCGAGAERAAKPSIETARAGWRPGGASRGAPHERLPRGRVTLGPRWPPPRSARSAVHGPTGGRAAVGAIAHPAATTLAEVVVDARRDTGAGEQRDRLHRRHEAGRVEMDADRLRRAETEQLSLLRHVPGAVAGTDPVGDLHSARDPVLAEHVVDVLGQALDGARPHAVEHDGQRQLARLPQLGATTLERFADRADGGRELGYGAPRTLDARDRQRDPARFERVALAARDGHPADHRARLHEAPPEGL